MLIMQWCLPFRLQHAGSFASLFGVSAKSTDANGRPNRASNVMEMSFLKVLSSHLLIAVHGATKE